MTNEISLSYQGPIDQGKEIQAQKPLTAENARVVALSAWKSGRLQQLPHFCTRSRERGFTILDVEFAIRYGRAISGPIFCEEPYNNYKYGFRARVDGIGLKVIFALNPTQDYDLAPLVILITAVWHTPTGTRF